MNANVFVGSGIAPGDWLGGLRIGSTTNFYWHMNHNDGQPSAERTIFVDDNVLIRF